MGFAPHDINLVNQPDAAKPLLQQHLGDSVGLQAYATSSPPKHPGQPTVEFSVLSQA